jgi:hypothetical protein
MAVFSRRTIGFWLRIKLHTKIMRFLYFKDHQLHNLGTQFEEHKTHLNRTLWLEHGSWLLSKRFCYCK